MEKQQLLDEIAQHAAEQNISLNEIASAYKSGKKSTTDVSNNQTIIASILYYLGAAIIFAGIAVLIWQHWSNLNFPIRLAVTFGVSIVAYITAVLFFSDQRFEILANAFFLISMLILPMGFYAIFDHYGFDIDSDSVLTMISGLCLIGSLLSYWLFRSNIFIIFNIVFGSWFLINLTNYLVDGNPYFVAIDFYSYRTMLLGIVYLLLGYHFSENEKAFLASVLYFFGSVALLGAVLDLSGWKPTQNLFWEVALPILCFGTIFISVPLRSRVLLTTGTLFLMMFIGKITAEYFVNSLGWPLALVIAGFLLILIGYGSLKVHLHFHK